MSNLAVELAERGVVPPSVLRWGIRRRCARQLARVEAAGEVQQERWLREWAGGRVALHTDAANEQHYELPPAYFRLVLGPALKYSGALYPSGGESLAAAERAMLALSAQRAQLEDGQRVLDLGCGWGSFALHIAEHQPGSRVLAVSNSRPQGEVIGARQQELGRGEVEHRVADVNALELEGGFDRIVSVEMLEHVRNHRALLRRAAGWLRPGGKMFVHVFAHRERLYPFDHEGRGEWMAQHFFTGGVMPSVELLPRAAAGALELEEQWWVDGTHYERTANHWLERHEAARDEVLAIFREVYGPGEAERWYHRWRLFYLACAELFGYAGGSEWGVAHYRFVRPS